jgi:cytochrome c-L
MTAEFYSAVFFGIFKVLSSMKIYSIFLLCLFVFACNEKESASDNKLTEIEKTPVASEPESSLDSVENKKQNAPLKFTKTTDNSEIKFPEKAFAGTEAEKTFMTTGKNIYVGDAEAVTVGKKRYNLWSCTQCHGPTAKGQVGPGLTGPKYNYAKNATNKGMFETIWNGTNGGMGAKGWGQMAQDDGITVDELLKIQAFIRSNNPNITGNE